MKDKLEKIGKYLISGNLKIATAESCTGGLLSSAFTDISGSSAFVHLNFVTYANEAKENILHVKNETLSLKGAVSEECAYEMAAGLQKITGADICISTTGIAGPTGGSLEKPVGLMYSAIVSRDTFKIYKIQKPETTPRVEMKKLFVENVIENLYNFLGLN